MQYTLIEKGEVQFDESSLFLEGAVLAANLTTKPLAPETWLEPLLGEGFKALQPVIEEQIHKQHNYIMMDNAENIRGERMWYLVGLVWVGRGHAEDPWHLRASVVVDNSQQTGANGAL